MSYYSDFLKELKKRGLTIDDVSTGSNKTTGGKTGGSVDIGNSSFANDFKKELGKLGLTIDDVTEGRLKNDPIRTRISNKYDDDDIAPLREDISPVKQEPWYKRGRFEDGYQFGDVTKSILGIEDKTKETPLKSYVDPDPNITLEELASKRDGSKSQADKLKYTQLYNQKYLAQTSKVLSETKMDGADHSILEEMASIARIDSGKEKRQRKEAVINQIEAMGIDPDDYALFVDDNNFSVETFAKWLGSGTKTGLNNFNMSLTNTADKILGQPLQKLGWENNPISKLDDYYTALYESSKYNTDLYKQKLGGGGGMQFAGEFVEGTTAALPNALLAIMTAGKSLEGTAAGLIQKAAYQGASILEKAGMTTLNMIKDPQYWMSFGRMYGNSYDEAIEKGASETTAALGATISSLLNAGVEIGFNGASGIQGLPDELAEGGTSKVLSWVTSALEEGGEEGVQKFIDEIIGKVLYKDDEEILNPIEYGKEMLLGTLSGAALGGGQLVAQKAQSAVGDAAKKRNEARLTENEQKVFDKVVEEEIAEAKKNGNVTKKDEAKIRETVRTKLEKGYISTDTIEEVLGGDSFKNYQDTVKSENDLVNQEKTLTEEYNKLNKMVNEKMTGEQQVRRDELRTLLPELRSQIENQNKNSKRSELKTKLSEEVRNLVNGSRLAESYIEIGRKRQAFQADLSQYNEKQQAVIKKAAESGILNNTNRTHEFVDMVAKLSADTGVLFDFTNNQKLKESGFALNGKTINGYVSKDGIAVNIQSAKALNTVVGHEITHVLKGTELYKELQTAAMKFAKNKGEFQGRYDALLKLYENVEDADIYEELTADLVGDYLFTDSGFINNLSTEHRNVFQRVYDEVKYLLKVATAGSKEARELEKVKKAFDDAYRNMGTKNTADSGVKYDIAALENGNVYVTASRKVIEGTTKSEQRKEISNFFSALLDGKPSLDIQTIEGDVLTITKKETAAKARDDYKTVNGQQIPMTDAEFTVKMHVESHIDEVAEVSKPSNSAQDNKNHPFAKDGFTYRRAYFEDFDGQYYEVTLSIGNNGTVATVYNVGKIKGSVPPSAKLIAVVGSKPLGGTLSKADIPQVAEKVKGQFSLSEAVEETKDLVALHNLTADKLSKSLELGGLPMPSLAITKSDIPHSNFGDITLVFGKETIDPKANKKNKVYSADAWTPVFPRVEYEADSTVANRISKKLYAVESKIDDTFHRDLRRIQFGFEDYLNSQGGEEGLIQYALDNYGLKAAYLEEQGKHIDKVTVQQEAEKGFNPANADKYQKIMDILGVTTAEEISKVNLKDARDNHGAELEAVYPGMTKSALRMGRMFGVVQSFIENQNSAPVYNTVTDVNATRKAVDEALDTEGFEAWTRNLFAGIVKDSGIYNNKDIFTPSGNRRSFKQTHLPVTLENIVKAMATQNGGNSKNVSGFNGIKTLRAATAETFKSVADMHNRKDRLQHLTQEQADALNDEMHNRLSEIIETIDNEGKRSGESNPYIRYDTIGETLTEIGESGKYNVADIQNVFRQYGKEISDDTALKVKQLLFDVTQMPVNIFEAKPQRVVGFDEAKAFVIPNNLDTKLKQELLNRGFSIAEYDPNVEGDRQRVVNQFEEYKFSLSDAGEQSKTYGNYNVYGKDVALEAPVQEDIAPVAENAALAAKNDTIAADSVEDLFPDDTAPMQEEYEYLLAERDDLKGAMDVFAAVGDTARAEQLMAEYEAVQARIAEIEADDSDRLASIDEADAPPEADNAPEDVADRVPLTKKLVDDLTRSAREQLGLSSRRSGEVRELIQRYSNEEFPSKAHLYTEIEERFGRHTESEIDEDLKGMKALLRTYPINVDESIKAEIADYAQLMRSNFGKVRFSKEGLPVDVAYKEFHEALPGYFPESIYVPTDQLLRIIEVANMDTTMQTEYEIDWQTLEDVTDTIMNGVAEFKQNRKETLANKHGRESFNSLMESADQFVPPVREDIAPVRKPAIQEVQSDDIAPVFDTSSGQQSLMPEVEEPKKVTRSELHFNIMNQIKTYFRNKGFDFDEVLKKAKDLSTFATVDNTPQRVLEKALGYKEGQMLSEMTVNAVARNETDGIRWLNSFTDKKDGLLWKISKQYGIKPGSKASAAAQMYAEGFYVGENDAIIAYGDKELAADFPNVKVQENIKKLARDPRIRQIYDETLAAINKSRTRNAYPEIPRLDNYFLHFRAMEDTFSRIGLPFNPNDIRAKDLPTDLNGVTADLKPGQPYFASAMHRTGKRTSFDLLGGLEKYLTSAKNQIYHIDDIQTLRALRNYVAETYGQANGLKDLDLMSDEEAEQRIKDVYNSHLSTFAKFLNEEANVIAGKTSLIDRGLEGVIGRRGITFLDTLNKQVGSNMVGFNVSSSLTNFLAPVQAFAKTNKYDFVKAMAQTSHNKIASIFGGGDNFAAESPVMIRRKGAERFYRTPYQKVGDAGYVLMGVVDDISTELIARTKYNEFTRKGMDSQNAHYETDKWVSRLMGDRSLGQQPQLYNSKMLGLFTKFQLEVRNQLDSQFYDTIQEAKASTEEIQNGLWRNAKKAAKITSTFAQLAVVQHLFGKAFESVAGYNPAFDIIEALIKTFGWDDEEEDEDTVLDNIEEGFLELLGDLPYTSTLTGGRIPIASALPVAQFIKGEDQYGNEKSRWQTLGDAAPYYVLPGGYGQIKKTKAGLKMFDDDLPIAGSYTDSGGLRFPVEDNLKNRVQAGLFGQWASENARDYFNNERKPLQEKQIQEFIDVDLPIADYWKYREGLAEHERLEDKIKYIEGLDLPISKKNILVNNATDRKNPIDLTNYDDFSGYEEFDFASKNPEKYEFLQRNNISYSEYLADEDTKDFYDDVYSWEKNNPEKVTVSKAITDSVVEYRQYSKELDAIRADKKSNGKTISGSAKKKKWAYIDSLDIDQGAKYILFKNEYNADDTYNYEIIDYLNGRDDVSRDEMITILKELSFEVSADGTITW